MTDDLFDEDGTFDDGFFSSLAAHPGDPASAYEPVAGGGAGEDDYHFLYESEGDGSFETDAEDFGDEDFDYGDAYDFDPGLYADPDADAEIDLEPDFDPDGDLHHEGDNEFGSEFGRGF
ncbi:hypothetical protein [Glycomyces sp. NPDC021274]|uniref:hypothetical protein n=1 Tax=Glycomyces sp. NPDC021274 TaxID=3155120 RepID=UPI0033C4C0CA